MPEEKFDDVENVLLGQKAIGDRKQGRINDLLRLKARAINALDEDLVNLGWKREDAPAIRKKASTFRTGMKIA
jgi:hypothetical protein